MKEKIISIHESKEAQEKRLNEVCEIVAVLDGKHINAIKSIKYCCVFMQNAFHNFDARVEYYGEFNPPGGPELAHMSGYLYKYNAANAYSADSRVHIPMHFCNVCGAKIDVQVEDLRPQ